MREITLGSLFDGSGGFPLTGHLRGMEAKWASEIEPYPIAVTSMHFPRMKHLGDIHGINGAEVEPVDVITFGSPCQDMSVAGTRTGLTGERSGLFFEAVRVIKEMREATNGKYPRFAIWENVFGAFSSNKGEDFRQVLETLIQIVEPTAAMPPVPKGGWAYADNYIGDGWSLAYRLFDAQYWGVPQRRRRIYLVADFGGECAGEILFEREGLLRDFKESGAAWKGTATASENSPGTADRANPVICFEPGIEARKGGHTWEDVAPTLRADPGDNLPAVAYTIENHPNDSRVDLSADGKVQTLTTRMGTGGGNIPMVMEPVWCLQGNGIDRADTAGCNGRGWNDETSYTLNSIDRPAVAYGVDVRNMNEYQELYPTLQAKTNGGQSLNFSGALHCNYIVRRLTPTECARLQGFPDNWGLLPKRSDLTFGEQMFWRKVRNEYARINRKKQKDWFGKELITWYNKLHTESAEYKMWGNGIALPNALYVMEGIVEAMKKEVTQNDSTAE